MAWNELVRRTHRVVASVILRVTQQWGGQSLEAVDDLVQETYLKLCADNCRLLRDFELRHELAFFGFLKVVATNVARDHFRATMSAKRGGMQTQNGLESLPGEPFRAQDPDRDILLSEIEACVRLNVESENPRRDLLIFLMYFRQGFTAEAIASFPSIDLTVKGVESTLLRLIRRIRQEVLGLSKKSALNREKGRSDSSTL